MPRIYLSLLLIITTSNLWSAAVEGIRLSSLAKGTRVVLELDSNVKYNTFTLTNPDRLVIDLKDSKRTENFIIPKLTNTPIGAIRHSMWEGHTLRLVLDLNHAIKYKSQTLSLNQKYPHRLIIDLLHKRKPLSIEPQMKPVVATMSLSPVITKAKNLRIRQHIIVAIDAGHGGQDSGALGKRGTKEKDVVLAITKHLAKLVNNEPGMKAFLTRDKDEFVTLRQRIKRAHKNDADMLISIHADASHNSRARGASVYVLSERGASSEAAQLLAHKENASDLAGHISLEDKDDLLAYVLLDLSQTASLEGSIEVANTVLSGLKRVGHIHRKHVESAAFVVLKSPDIPSLLVETAFISNPDEESKLISTSHQNKLAHAMFDGIRSYFENNPLLNEAPTQKHIVSRGDTLSAIAQRYRITLTQLKAKNQLQTNKLKIGDVLIIP